MEQIKAGDNVVLIHNAGDAPPQVKLENVNVTSKTTEEITALTKSGTDFVIVANFNKDHLKQILEVLKPGGKLIIQKHSDSLNDVELNLKISGFTNVSGEGEVVCSKPSYATSATTKISLKKPAAAVWKLDGGEDEEETIDPDDLLDEDDLKKPTAESLRVCGTTGKRKACRDCSCGLADELEGEKKAGDVIDTGNAPKSSCGSCYLGDAFRCATCPYLGMPAFKPGEKIQLAGAQLQDDI